MKGKIAQHQKKRRTRQVYILLQDLLNRFPYLEGWGVGAKSLAAKAVQTDRQTQTDTGKHLFADFIRMANVNSIPNANLNIL